MCIRDRVATDRISCFDVILNNVVTKKGTVLTQMSKFWFNLTKDIIPNHMISTNVKDMPEFFQKPEFDGNSMMCRKLEMLPIECIVRGYITAVSYTHLILYEISTKEYEPKEFTVYHGTFQHINNA